MHCRLRIVVSAALALSSCLSGGAAAASDGPRLEVGQSAPTFFLPLMNADSQGQRIFRLRDYVGPDGARSAKRGVLLNFAASYCVICKAELVALKARKAKFDAAGVALAVIVIDTEKEGIEQMRALTVDKLKLPYPVLSDRFGVLARRYGVEALPMSVWLAPDGRIVWLETGMNLKAIDRMLATTHAAYRREARAQ